MKKCVPGKYKPNEKFKLPDGANPTNSSGPRDTLCKYYDDCMKYVLQEERFSFYFSCINCPEANKAIKASKPAKAEITGKPTVKSFELPKGANPVRVSVYEPVYTSCKFYKNCRRHIRRKHKDWIYFSCTKCPKASEFIRAQGSSSNIRRVAKRAKAKTLKGKRQSQDTPMGYKVIQQKNYRSEGRKSYG